MKPIAVIPMNDPTGLNFLLLRGITPQLKHVFERVFVSVGVPTAQGQPEDVLWLKREPFFVPLFHVFEMPVGADFLALYKFAAESTDPEELLHLCFIDRLAFALQTGYRESFLADITAVTPDMAPLLFERSQLAWETHPQNYREFEQMIRRTGEWLLGESWDFAWCYMVIQAKQLQALIPNVMRDDISFIAELVVLQRDRLHTREVDWLAWEDPFILNRDPQELKQEREQSEAECLKRLDYVSGMLDVLQTAVTKKL